ncbi:MAG: PilZ domain-containing protein [Planctomycetota bacterium]
MQRESTTEKLANQGPEKRRWARAQADLPITLFLQNGKCEARIRDISRAGVCFFLDRPVPLMTVLRMSLGLRVQDGIRYVNGYGAVVRCEKISKAIDHYEIALFLNEMAEADRKAIEDFVAAQNAARRPPPPAS